MATLLVKLRVADFATWRKIFDGMAPVRQQHGITASTIHRDADDPNVIVVVNRARTVDDARLHARSSELRDAMARAGMQGVPEVNILEDVA